MKKSLNILRRTVFILLAVLLFLVVFIQFDFVQNRLISIAVNQLQKGLGTQATVKHVSFSLFNKVNMDGVLLRDKQKDTLLYAGQLKVRITDWFFLKNRADLKYIGLEDAVIKLQRKDSIWNYQYIVDFFAAPPSKKTKKTAFVLDLKKVDLKNVWFLQNDNWHGQRMTAHVTSLLMDADKVDFDKTSFNIKTLSIDEPYFALDNIPELRPAAIKKRDDALFALADTGLQFNLGFDANVQQIQLNNGTFVSNTDNKKPTANFDGAHVYLKQITGVFNHFVFKKDTLTASVNLSAKERCGFDLKKLKTQLKITPQIIELAKLDLQANKSRIGDYYSMKFKHFNNNFGNYTTQVLMDGWFKNANVASDDVAYFAPALKAWKKQVVLNGILKGTVSDFSVKNMFLRSNTGTSIAGNLTMKGLPNINTTLIHFNDGAITTTMTDLGVVIPPLQQITEPNLAALGNIIFKGNFNGTLNNFSTQSVISTNLGGIANSLNMKLTGEDYVYQGSVVTNRFNLGKFLNTSVLGLIDFKGKIEGSSFNINRLKSTLDGTFSHLEFNGYNYSNIVTKGTFQKKYFSGEVKIDDPNVDFTSNLEIDLTQAQPKFNILGDLVKCDFQKINLTPKENYQLTGLFDLNFSGSNIDEFLGAAKLLNANLTHNNNRLSFDSLVIQSQFADSIKTLTATSNEFSFGVSGKSYRLLDLPVYFQSYLHRYYPTYFDAPAKYPASQEFKFSLNTKQFDKYATLIDKRLSGLDYAKIEGSIDQASNEFKFLATVPTLTFDKYHISDASLQGDGRLDTLDILGNITNVRVGDSLNFPNSVFSVTSSKDHSVVNIQTKADNTLNEANINADLFTLEDGVRIHFNPSSFVINDKKWNLEKQGEIVIRKNFVSAENVKFSQGFQEIKVETELDNDGGNTNNLKVKLKNVFVGDITSLFIKNNKFEGIANGDLRMNDFFGDFTVEAKVKTEQFRMNADSIGIVNLNATYDNKTGVVKYGVQSPNEGYHLNADGAFATKDSTSSPLLVNINLEDSKIDLIQQFLGDIFSNMSGKATGKLSISGKPNSPNLEGTVQLRNAGLKVNFTQVYYKIDSAKIKFTKEGIDFGGFDIYDKYGNEGWVEGKLHEQGFKNMVFDFDIDTEKLLLIDTKSKDNSRFYGKAIGKATMSFYGPETAARMDIVAEANDSSHIFIPNSINRESGEADFIVFAKHGTEIEVTKPKSNFDLTVDLDITANNKMNIDVILDELTGDVIKANGNGRLHILAGTSTDVSIKGRYNINKGSYNFNFQSFIRKPFDLLPEAGNYIEWNGDPFKADLHIDANYTAENVSVSELINGQQGAVNSDTKTYRGKVFVIAELRDKLTKPTINFKLDFPENSPIKSDAVFTQFLTTIQNNQNEMLSQASSLIVFGTFAPYGQGFLGGNSGGTSLTTYGVSTITQVLTKEVNKAVSGLLFKLTKDKSLKFDIGANIYSSSSIINQSGNITANSNSLDRSRLNFKVGKSFFEDKILVTFGGDLDFNVGNTSNIANGNFQWLPDLNVEFILSQDKRLRAIAFSKNSLDISGNSLGRRNRQGVSLSYKKDFERNPFEKTVLLLPSATSPARRQYAPQLKSSPDSSATKTNTP